MSYHVVGRARGQHYQVNGQLVHASQLQGLGFSLKPSKKVRRFVRKYGKRIAIGTAIAIAAPFVLPAAAGAVFSAGKAAFAAGSSLIPRLLHKKVSLPDMGPLPNFSQRGGAPDQQMPTVDQPVDASAPMFPSGGTGSSGSGSAAMTATAEPTDDTTPEPAPAQAGGAGLAIGALLVGGLLLAGSRRKG